MSIPVRTIVSFLDETLSTKTVKDNSRNGLQVQGSAQVKRVGLAVDACLASFKAAVDEGCQMIVCHHGIIWDGIRYVTGRTYEQIRFLIENDLNLYVSHLPLDIHPELGNNIGLARMLGLKKIKPFGDLFGVKIGFGGSLASPLPFGRLVAKIEKGLDTKCVTLPFGPKQVRSVAVVSGGGARELEQAIDEGYDCYLTGESSHHNHHTALEARINAVFAGHYATETPGVRSVGKLLEKKFGVTTVFLDVPTTV
jgi:dinuclear metal center YbgI/SA1388 family protein